jgi:hypothetical protein
MSVGRIPNPEGSPEFAHIPGWFGWWRPGWWGWWHPGWWGWWLLRDIGEEIEHQKIGDLYIKQAEELVKQAETLKRMGEGMKKG